MSIFELFKKQSPNLKQKVLNDKVAVFKGSNDNTVSDNNFGNQTTTVNNIIIPTCNTLEVSLNPENMKLYFLIAWG